jgi:RHS repeat-associated protein
MEQSKGTAEKRTITFKYDPMGRRIEKKLVTVLNNVTQPTTTWSYVYDGDNIIMETLQVEGASAVKTFYTHGQGTDEHLALERGGQFYYYLADGLGSVTAITDASKVVKQSYTYDSFGMAKAANNTFLNSYTYTGREWDKESGLYYYRARYYDPMEGRFLSRDPIEFEGGINLYAYVENNPINFDDPLGLSASDWLMEKLKKKPDQIKNLKCVQEAMSEAAYPIEKCGKCAQSARVVEVDGPGAIFLPCLKLWCEKHKDAPECGCEK